MKVNVNGTIQTLPDNLTVTGLLEELGYGERGAIVKRGGDAVPEHLHAEITVNEGDHVEILAADKGD